MIILIIFFFLFVESANGIYLNPYSYGSYDPAAESPELYNYYARYYNPNRHNPYAPYPTYMKPGVFRLPRMYQIDPAWAPYYPPNRFETLPQAQGNFQTFFRSRALGESVAVFPDGCGGGGGDRNIGGNKITEPKSETELLLEDLDKGGNGGYIGRQSHISGDYNQGQNKERPRWSATQPTSEILAGFGQKATLIRPRVNHPSSGFVSNDPRNSPPFEGGRSGCSACGGGVESQRPNYAGTGCVPCEGGDFDSESNIASDFERLPLDRINNSPDSDSDGFPNPSSNPNFNRHKRRYILH